MSFDLAKPWQRRTLTAVVAVAVLLPRFVALDAFAIQDEYLWLNRGHLYVRFISEQNWEILHRYPPFSLHPGATLLWLTGPLVSSYAAVQGLTTPFETWTPDDQRAAAAVTRAGLGLATGILLLTLFALLLRTRFFSTRPLATATAVIFLGLEPWVLGISRTVHLDALLSLFLLLATAATVVAREQRRSTTAALAGGLWGLAFMTKSPAFFFLTVTLLPLLLRPLRYWRVTFRQAVLWLGTAALTIFAVWPPMWFHPLLRLQDIYRQMFSHVEMPEVYLWPGWHPPLFLTTLSTVALGGVLFYLVLRVRDVTRGRRDGQFLATDLFLLGGALFALLLVAAGGDHARKNLPALAFLALPAAVGWLRLAERFRVLPAVAAGAVLVLQAAIVLPWFPHLPTYHNVLLRSPDGKRLLVDVGNGARLVADYFNARGPAVFATNLPGLVRPYLTEDRRGNVRRLPKSGNLAELGADVEYLVIPESTPARVNFDRGAGPLLTAVAGRTPEAVLKVRDVPLFSIVRVR